MSKTKRRPSGFAEQPNADFKPERKRGGASRPDVLEVPITSAQRRLIERAASLSGLSVGEFARISVDSAARRVAETNELTILSARDSLKFAEALLHPPAPNRRLRAAARRHKAMLDAQSG